MKKIFTLLVAMSMATSMIAQMHGAMKFAGVSTNTVNGQSTPTPSDTIQFAMNGMTSGNITFPEMKGMSTIPSFTVKDVAFTMDADHKVTFPEQTFSTTITVNNEEKTITGSSLSGSYNMADNSMTITAVFKYGKMPLELTYNITAYYVKPVTNSINVNVGGSYNYQNGNVTYNVRKYKDGDIEKVDVEIPEYSLENTLMGNLTLGTYTVKGLTYDETKGGYYHDYAGEGLKFHFKAEGGMMDADTDYEFLAGKNNNILVKYEGNKVTDIINNFQPGLMPFPITSTFYTTPSTGISSIKNAAKLADGKMYNLSGQLVGEDYKGIVIVNGKKYLKK